MKQIGNLHLYLIAAFISLAIAYFQREFLYGDDYWFYVLQDKFTQSQIEKFIEQRQAGDWLYLIEIPLVLLIKTWVITFCLISGIFFINKELSISSTYRICIKAEFIFLLPSLLQLIWFGFFNRFFSITELIEYPTFSLFDLFKWAELNRRLIYPLRVINLFELVYISMLAYYLSQEIKSTFLYALKVTMGTYGFALLLWITFIIYLNSIL